MGLGIIRRAPEPGNFKNLTLRKQVSLKRGLNLHKGIIFSSQIWQLRPNWAGFNPNSSQFSPFGNFWTLHRFGKSFFPPYIRFYTLGYLELLPGGQFLINVGRLEGGIEISIYAGFHGFREKSFVLAPLNQWGFILRESFRV